MSLQPSNAKTTIEQQNRHEYATQKVFSRLYATLPKNRRSSFGVNRMRQIRENWGLDFSQAGAKISDFNRLADFLPNNEIFNEARDLLGDPSFIKSTFKTARDEYTELQNQNMYPVLILDPQLQNVPGMDQVRTFGAVTRGSSLRDLNRNQAQSIYRGRSSNLIFDSNSITNPFGNENTQNMNQTNRRNQRQQRSRQTQQQQATQQQSASQNVIYTGWTTTEDSGPGLDNALGAYFTPAEQEQLREHFDGNNVEITEDKAEFLENSIAVLQHLRSNGVGFELRDFYEDGQIDVKLDGSSMSVRVFELSQPGQYVGRLYDSYGMTYVQGSGREDSNLTLTPEEALLPLRVTLGDVSGEYRKTVSTANSRVVNVEGLSAGKHVMIKRDSPHHQNRFNGIIYRNEEEAVDYLNTVIEGADSYLESQLKFEELKEGLTSEDFEISSVLSPDLVVRERQEYLIDDAIAIHDMVESGFVDDIESIVQSVDGSSLDMDRLTGSQEEIADYLNEVIHSELVGDLESGFNPSFVIQHAPEDSYRQHSRNSLMAALREINYDTDLLKGNEFATQNVKDRLVTFDSETAKSIDEVDNEFMQEAMRRVQDQLAEVGVVGPDKDNPPKVLVDDQGIIQWEGHRSVYQASRRSRAPKGTEDIPGHGRIESDAISGQIGQIFAPDEHGIVKTSFGSGGNYGIVPGYVGYFKFDGEYTDERMDRFRVKGFEQHMNEKIDTMVRQQVSRPQKTSWDNIPDDFDSTGLNGLYHGDVYGRRIDLDFMERSQLNEETKTAIVKSLSNRVRFGNEYGDHATTDAEAQAKRDTQHEDQASFTYWKAAGEQNMRMLGDDLVNIADMTMTGNARTQGLTWYLVDSARVNEDGSITPGSGTMNLDGSYEPDTTAIRKLDYFEFEKYNAWDRVQMSSNQLITAEKVDEKVGTAMMSFGGWTYEDSFAVSKEFAVRNMLQGDIPNEDSMKVLDSLVTNLSDYEVGSSEWDRVKGDILKDTHMHWTDEVIADGVELQTKLAETKGDLDKSSALQQDYDAHLESHGTFRPLRRGDKLSDFGGNKGTIGIVVDRDMDPAEAEKLELTREVEVFNANPKLDVVVAPYSPLSRFNAGILHELQDGEVLDIEDPGWNNGEGRTLEGGLGELNFIVTDLTVDEKTHAYTEADVAQGRGRLASGQLAWALQSHEALGMLSEIYGHNDQAWSTFREYLITTGLDMGPDGELRVGYEPHDYSETRQVFNHEDYDTADDFLNEITDKGGFLEVPFEMKFITGDKTDKVPILSAALRQDTELIDGQMRRSDFNNYYTKMFENIKDYTKAMDEGVLDSKKDEVERQRRMTDAQDSARDYFERVQVEIKDRQIEGVSNGKHSFIRDKIMGVRMKHSATGVAISDPRLSIKDVTMDSDMMDSLDSKPGDILPVWRDPVWRRSAISSHTIVGDESVHGFGVNPAMMGAKDGDFDGDTLGSFKLSSKDSIKELESNLAQHNNMIDTGTSDSRLFLPMDQDFATAHAEAESLGDNRLDKLRESIDENARSKDERLRKKSVTDADKYIKIAFRELGYGGDYVNLKSRETVMESMKQMSDRGAKGSPSAIVDLKEYYDGEKGRETAKEIQYSRGVQTDDTGRGGAVSQRLVAATRNKGIDAALEATYPVSQSILQLKRDADQAKRIDGHLRREIPNLYQGKSSDGKTENMTKSAWVKDYHKLLTDENKLNVDVRKDMVEDISEFMAGDGNVIRDIETVIRKEASPMDQVAYGGGWERLVEMAKENRSMLEGRMTKLFAPESMRNNEVDVLARADTRDLDAEREAREAFEQGMARNYDDLSYTKQTRTNKEPMVAKTEPVVEDLDPGLGF